MIVWYSHYTQKRVCRTRHSWYVQWPNSFNITLVQRYRKSIKNISNGRKQCYIGFLHGIANATCHLKGCYILYVGRDHSCQLVLRKFIPVPNWFSLLSWIVIIQQLVNFCKLLVILHHSKKNYHFLEIVTLWLIEGCWCHIHSNFELIHLISNYFYRLLSRILM